MHSSHIDEHFVSKKSREATTSKKRKHESDMPQAKIRVGNRDLVWGKHIKPMTEEATNAYQKGDYGHVKHCLDRDGYILIRGALQPQTVLNARRTILSHLHTKNALLVKNDDDMMNANIGMDEDGKLLEGWTVDAESGGVVGGREDDSSVDGWYNVGNSRALLDVYNGDQLKSFYHNVFGAVCHTDSKEEISKHSQTFLSTSLTPIVLPDCTWLRMKGRGEVTAEHADYYYFRNHTDIFRSYWKWSRGEEHVKEKESWHQSCSICCKSSGSFLHCTLCDVYTHASCLPRGVTRITPPEGEWHCAECSNEPMQYYTCWTALGSVNNKDGSLCVIPGSHRLSGYHKPSRPDLLPAEYTKSFENASVWLTAPQMSPGDVILFNIKTIHAATRNQSYQFRLSCDTRVVVSSNPDTNIMRARDIEAATARGERPRKKLGMSMMTARPRDGSGMMGMTAETPIHDDGEIDIDIDIDNIDNIDTDCAPTSKRTRK